MNHRHPPNDDPENWHPPQPTHSEGGVFAAVHADLRRRDAKGWTEHGVMLDYRYNKNWLQEAYEEALDLAVYLKAELMRQEERDGRLHNGGQSGVDAGGRCCR